MLTSEVLRKARGLLDAPEKWSCHGWGTDDQPCVIHALKIVTRDEVFAVCHTDAYKLFKRVVGCYPGDFNDRSGHAEVLAAFDTAIAWAEAMEQEFNINACTPVDMRRPDHAAFFLSREDTGTAAESPHPLLGQLDQSAWERAWKDFE